MPHPPYSPDLAPSDFYLFGPMKEALGGTRFETDEDVMKAVRKWLREQPAEFYRDGIRALIQRWTKAIDKMGDYTEK